ncbi:MAG: phospho-N-acetylmuramoyl-pentapeptide-transferase, partial [Deltaproteobacteria bacterium]|jgi:phospho-N-acetylmuramoyl-pentapeptide-transferase|nr:phospho-N-acetylmuramoyl-pentapeptide-transferase [Deltaproteobacteria bacterium]NOQ86257.1 phospho-N-acetylmuramoyl-pentapeptide-transferase [Deltaproteobacteria bacterium]
MLYHLFYPLHEAYSIFNVFRYITFRTIYAILTALLITLILGPYLIKKLQALNIKQYIRADGPSAHLNKSGTPTMGGILILLSLTIATLFWGDLTNIYIWIALLTTWGLGIIGIIDDLKKLRSKSSDGVSPRFKLCGQILLGAALGTFLYLSPDFDKNLTIPFFKAISINLGIFYILFVIVLIVGTSNAVNLTDGLDGLAIGLVLIVTTTYLLFSYFSGHIKIANYLQIPYIPGSGELTIFCGALFGAATGFLWFNTYPAQVFMGDVGSLALGGALGTVAIITKHEILLAIVGGVFVAEALSVILQVTSYKLRKKRIFAMAPLHHHYELKGWAEPKIIVRFWIVAAFLALVAISTLKLR